MDKFRSGHLSLLILGVAIVSLKTYPRVYMINGQRDSWIAMIISSVIIFFFFLYIINVWRKSNEKNMVKIYQQAFGKRFGNLFIFLFTVNLFITLVESAAVEADSMHQNMLLESPKWYFLLFFIVPCAYIVGRNIVAIITTTIIGITLIVIAGINLAFLTAGYKHLSLLFPIFERGITWNFILAVLETLGLYGCVSITLPYLSRLESKDNKLIRNVILGMLMLIQMEIISVTGILSTFDLERAVSMNYPKLLQTQRVSYLQFLDFGELYVMLQILGGWLLKYVISFFGILIILRSYNFPRKLMKYVTLIISGLAFGGAYLASRDSFVLFELLNYYQYICLFNFVIIPLVVFTIAGMKRKRAGG